VAQSKKRRWLRILSFETCEGLGKGGIMCGKEVVVKEGKWMYVVTGKRYRRYSMGIACRM